MSQISRRRFLKLSALALPAALVVDTRLVEPTNLKVSHLTVNPGGSLRFIHFSDFHHKGDTRYADKVIRTINDLKPEFVCFTGDLVEEIKFFPEALEFISQIKVPVYGSPGNHDYHCRAPFSEFQRVFSATGGAWLEDTNFVVTERDLELVGMGHDGVPMLKTPQAGCRFLLTHYPKSVDDLGDHRFDWIMAGHSHGGQVRIPGYGAIALPWGVGPYDLGYFKTKAGPLYVNAGIGTYRVPWRFNCRPEITVVTI
jgi:predicted MPP superfamily phosphohydrolase